MKARNTSEMEEDEDINCITVPTPHYVSDTTQHNNLLQRQDSLLAKQLYQEEVKMREQSYPLGNYYDDSEIQKHTYDDVDNSVERTEKSRVSGNSDKDAELAKQLHDNEMAYHMQVEFDRQFAESLIADDGNSQVVQGAHHIPHLSDTVIDAQQKTSQMNRSSVRNAACNEQQDSPFFATAAYQNSNPNRNNERGRFNPPHRPFGFRSTNNVRVRSRGYGMGRHNFRQSNVADAADAPEDDYEALWDLADRLGEVKVRGMEESEVSSLPTTNYTGGQSGASNTEEDTSCKVCLTDFEQNDKLRLLPCFHKYHIECIDTWIKTNATCPICKLDIKEELKKQLKR